MDYFETTERYRKKAIYKTLRRVLVLLLVAVAVWVGWLWGYDQRAILTVSNTDRLIALIQENERLEQRLARQSSELDGEREARIKAELLAGEGDDASDQRRLAARIADHLAGGVEADAIGFALRTLDAPLRCRNIDALDMSVATGLYAGADSVASVLDGAVKISIEGEARSGATGDKPWFDPARPVALRITYLEGEKIVTGNLPLVASIIADTWLIRINTEQAPGLQGYVNIALEKCSFR